MIKEWNDNSKYIGRTEDTFCAELVKELSGKDNYMVSG